MTTVWPSDLPQRVNRSGFSLTLPDGRRAVPTDSGPPRMRRRFSSAARPVSIGLTLTDGQLRRFDAFWQADTGGGALPFWFPDQVRGGVALTTPAGVPLRTAGGALLLTSAWWLVLFAANTAPQVSSVGAGNWLVQIQLTVMP